MKYILLCIGNRYGGDDSVGPYIADEFKKIENEEFLIIDSGSVPENYTTVIKNKKPENLLIIDAIEMGLDPGDMRVIPREKIGVMHISTHNIPLSIFIEYIEPYAGNIVLIGIQPKRLSGKMTNPIKKSANVLIKIIKNHQLDKIESYQ